ncbi:MAG TPA: heparinase II/III family protein [Pilimelia sp.]|nr:heparinase II/III family protein [Pilimelia sp.]
MRLARRATTGRVGAIAARTAAATALVLALLSGCDGFGGSPTPTGPPPPSPAPPVVGEQPRPVLGVGRACAAAPARTRGLRATVRRGQPFVVGEIPAAMWREPPTADASGQLAFWGFMYLPPMVVRAHRDRDRAALTTMVEQLVRFHAENPDPGRNLRGWDEGATFRRLDALTCLYAATGDARLRGPMYANVRVLFSSRYYGPPYRAVHNHGVFANLAVWNAGLLLGAEEWVRRARERIAAEAPQAFTRAGMTREQSSKYQKVNLDVWKRAADRIAERDPHDPVVTALRAVLERGAQVLGWLVEPDGRLVQLGNTERLAVRGAPGRGDLWRDDEAGVAVGRWSWTDPATTYYTVRYGPPTQAHGHAEHGGVTFTAGGARVLVNPGLYTYDRESPWHRYARSPEGANTAVPASGAPIKGRRAQLRSLGHGQGCHRWQISGRVGPHDHTRDVTVDGHGRRMAVTDGYADPTPFTQFWHLDPDWRPAGGDTRQQVFRHTSGRVLTVATTGVLAPPLIGAEVPPAGWHFPRQGVRRPAPEVRVASAGGPVTTTFTVS